MALVAVVVLLGGGAAVFFGFFWEGQGPEGQALPVGPTKVGVDEPRTPPTYAEPGGDGGEYGQSLLASLKSAGFACARMEGSLSAREVCYRRQSEPAPTIQKVVTSISGDEVVAVRASVDLDPALTDLAKEAGRQDVRAVQQKVFELLIASTIPDGERPTVGEVLGDALEETNAKSDIASGSVRITVGETSGQYLLERHVDGESGAVGIHNGLEYVTPKQLQAAAEKSGFTCRREAEMLTCDRGKAHLEVEFPRPPGETQTQYVTSVNLFTELGLQGPPPPGLVDLAQSIAELVGGVFDEGDAARSWVADCFGPATVEAVYGHAQFRCEPEVSGTLKHPEATAYLMSVGRIEGT